MKNRKPILFFILLSFTFFLGAEPKQKISELSDFRLLGERTIFSEPEFSDDAILYRTLNHEGGLNVRTLRIGERDEAENGAWYFVILNAGVWAETGERVKAGEKFWIFISDDEDIFNYEET